MDTKKQLKALRDKIKNKTQECAKMIEEIKLTSKQGYILCDKKEIVEIKEEKQKK